MLANWSVGHINAGGSYVYPCIILRVETEMNSTMSQLYIYTGYPRRNVPYFGRVFLMLKYTDITQNTYV